MVAPTIDGYRRLPSSSSRFFVRLVERKFRSCSWCEGGITVLHAKALDDVLRVLFLVDDDRSFFAITGYVDTEHPRHVAHVFHLETIHKLYLELVQQLLVRAQWKNLIHVQRKNDKASVIPEYINA